MDELTMDVETRQAFHQSIAMTLTWLSCAQMDELLIVIDGVVDCWAERDLLREKDFEKVTFLKAGHIRKLLAAWSEDATRTSGASSDPARPLPPGASSPSSPRSSTPRLPTPTFSPVAAAPLPNWVGNFTIPWKDLSIEAAMDLAKAGTCKSRTRCSLVTVIFNAISKITMRPKKKELDKIAEKAVTKYPSLKDVLGSEVIGSGFHGLSVQLVRKFENGKRKPKSASTPDSPCPPKKQRRVRKDEYGCAEGRYNPDELPPGQTLQTQELLRRLLFEHAANQKRKTADEEKRLEQAQKDSYVTQRWDIVRLDSASAVVARWPSLITIRGISFHCDELLGFGLVPTYRRRMDMLKEIVRHYLQSKALGDLGKHLDSQDEGELLLSFIVGFSKVFKEDGQVLLVQSEVETERQDVERDATLPESPVLVCLCEDGQDVCQAGSFMLAIDRKVIGPPITGAVVAVHKLFASFYMYGLQYPDECGRTLELLQRLFYGINVPGSREGVKRNDKVLAIIREFHESLLAPM